MRQRFARTLQTLRSRHGQGRNVVLLVMIDGDKKGVQERKEQLYSDLARQPGEPIAILVPNRNIESWFAFLDDKFESESVDYKRGYGKGTRNAEYGKRLRERCARGEPGPLPASLQDACIEWNSLQVG